MIFIQNLTLEKQAFLYVLVFYIPDNDHFYLCVCVVKKKKESLFLSGLESSELKQTFR